MTFEPTPRAQPPPQGQPEEKLAPMAGRAAGRGTALAILAGFGFAIWLILQLFGPILLPFVAAFGIAYVLHPAAARLARAGLPRGIVAALLMIALIAATLLFALLLYPLILAQMSILANRAPVYVGMLRDFANGMMAELQERLGPQFVDSHLRDLVSSQAGAMLSFLVGAITRVIGSGFALFNVLSLVIVTPVVTFYLLRDWPQLIAAINSWLPRRYAELIRAQAREVDRILSAWVRGQALCSLVLALYYATALSLVGLDLGLIVGLTAGILSFIPYVGSITGFVVSIALALAQFPTWGGVLRVIIVFAVGQILEGYVIYPRFLGDRVELHAVWVIFALFAGGAAFGFLGVLLAVPAAATIGVLIRFWLRRYMASPFYLEPPPETRAESGKTSASPAKVASHESV